MIPILEIIVVIFAIFAITRSWIRLKKGNETIIEFLFWVVVWLTIVGIVFIPQITSFPAKILNISRGIDVFVYFGIVALFYLIFRVFTKIENLERDITKLTRIIALKDAKEKNKKKK
jgi:small membrane protein